MPRCRGGRRPSFPELIEDAAATAIDGWHFSFLDGRRTSEPLPWGYEHLASDLAASASRVVDVDTGGREVLARLAPPAGSVAVEDWPVNLPIATERLRPLGMDVRGRADGRLPVGGTADLVLNRHGDLDLAETISGRLSGGRHEPVEIIAQTVVREVLEETRLRRDGHRPLPFRRHLHQPFEESP